MSIAPTFDHIAFTVPDLKAVVDRLTADFGMVAELSSEQFALVERFFTGA